MSNSCNQTPTLSNTAEIVENESRFKLSPLRWNRNYQTICKNILLKVLIIGVPTYTVAIITKAMVFTMPMLAITTVIATNLYDDAKENENRVDEGDAADGGDIGDLDG